MSLMDKEQSAQLQNEWLCRIEGQVNQVIAIWPAVLPHEKFVYLMM